MRTFVIMGVSGTGKSSIGKELAYRLGGNFLDGDFLHPKHNIQKMKSGEALEDSDRYPWLRILGDAIYAMTQTDGVSFLVCSSLKKEYRDIIRTDNSNLSFLFLDAPFDVIKARLLERKGHFFKESMLYSQFQTLEQPESSETDILHIDASLPFEEVMTECLTKINSKEITGDL